MTGSNSQSRSEDPQHSPYSCKTKQRVECLISLYGPRLSDTKLRVWQQSYSEIRATVPLPAPCSLQPVPLSGHSHRVRGKPGSVWRGNLCVYSIAPCSWLDLKLHGILFFIQNPFFMSHDALTWPGLLIKSPVNIAVSVRGFPPGENVSPVTVTPAIWAPPSHIT